ncbi:MAG: sugar phosphate isomerase/epimerase [Acidobacteriota bacterium]|nr:sugar phosphate isomerase/epimerase [Acidobacteriota bacterium]
MEGRLVPPEHGRFQAFPRERWMDEFALAREVPLSFIEWIYDLYGAEDNPLTKDLARLQALSRETQVATRSLCADYFMDLPFLRCSAAECAERQQLLNRLLGLAAQVGIQRLILPFVDASRIETREDRDTVIRVLHEALPTARETGVELHLETSLPPLAFARLLDRIPDAMVKVNYDSGNSSSLGFAPAEEFAAYGERIGSIHIKDRIRHGGTVPLGTGDADFPAVFQEMTKVDYSGDITMQVARSEPGREVEWARVNRAFIASFWPVE